MSNNASVNSNVSIDTDIGFDIRIVRANLLSVEADVMTLIYPQEWTTLGHKVLEAMPNAADVFKHPPRPGKWQFIPSNGAVHAKSILLIGTPPRADFTYDKLRQVSRLILTALYESGNTPRAQQVATNVFGTGWGFDEADAFRAMLLGLVSAVEDEIYPGQLERLSIIENRTSRADLFTRVLSNFWNGNKDAPVSRPSAKPKAASSVTAPVRLTPDLPKPAKPLASLSQPSIFVAMPFADHYNNLYIDCIRPAIKVNDCQCIRLDQVSYTGDVLDTIKSRIKAAKIVIGVLDGLNPNVFLEIGYAWGIGVPTMLLVSNDQTKGAILPFDVRGQRYIPYESPLELAERLPAEIKGVLEQLAPQ
jgi:hypothetical protein